MSEFDDIDGETGEGGASPAADSAVDESNEDEDPGVPADCISCGGAVQGLFCPVCGQQQDDMRRSLGMLALNFVEDTFSFDSRMWRTLGLLAVAPGVVPTEFSHGRRSRFTPPIRLFLVISFLFFVTISLTNTLFVGMEVDFRDVDEEKLQEAVAQVAEHGVDISDEVTDNCAFEGNLRFFVKEKDLRTDYERFDACLAKREAAAHDAVANSTDVAVGETTTIEEERAQADKIVERVFDGIGWAVRNPTAFNDSMNDWLPRVMFFMTPVLALILSLFLRRDALIFDHMVLSLYVHAVNFAIVGAALILGQFGAPQIGAAAVVIVAIYYVTALKRAHKRG